MIYSLHINDSTLPKQLFSRYTMIIIVDNMDNGKVTALTLLDLSAALDTIDHPILHNAFRDILAFLAQFLGGLNHIFQTDTKALTYLAHHLAHNTFGVPQESVLGPVLFSFLSQIIPCENISWKYMVYHGMSLYYMVLHGKPWYTMTLHGKLWCTILSYVV